MVRPDARALRASIGMIVVERVERRWPRTDVMRVGDNALHHSGARSAERALDLTVRNCSYARPGPKCLLGPTASSRLPLREPSDERKPPGLSGSARDQAPKRLARSATQSTG